MISYREQLDIFRTLTTNIPFVSNKAVVCVQRRLTNESERKQNKGLFERYTPDERVQSRVGFVRIAFKWLFQLDFRVDLCDFDHTTDYIKVGFIVGVI